MSHRSRNAVKRPPPAGASPETRVYSGAVRALALGAAAIASRCHPAVAPPAEGLSVFWDPGSSRPHKGLLLPSLLTPSRLALFPPESPSPPPPASPEDSPSWLDEQECEFQLLERLQAGDFDRHEALLEAFQECMQRGLIEVLLPLNDLPSLRAYTRPPGPDARPPAAAPAQWAAIGSAVCAFFAGVRAEWAGIIRKLEEVPKTGTLATSVGQAALRTCYWHLFWERVIHNMVAAHHGDGGELAAALFAEGGAFSSAARCGASVAVNALRTPHRFSRRAVNRVSWRLLKTGLDHQLALLRSALASVATGDAGPQRRKSVRFAGDTVFDHGGTQPCHEGGGERGNCAEDEPWPNSVTRHRASGSASGGVGETGGKTGGYEGKFSAGDDDASGDRTVPRRPTGSSSSSSSSSSSGSRRSAGVPIRLGGDIGASVGNGGGGAKLRRAGSAVFGSQLLAGAGLPSSFSTSSSATGARSAARSRIPVGAAARTREGGRASRAGLWADSGAGEGATKPRGAVIARPVRRAKSGTR